MTSNATSVPASSDFYPHIGVETLRRHFHERVALLAHDPDALLPPWARTHADSLLRRRKLILCGSMDRPEMRLLAQHFDVIAVVDDFLRKKQDSVLGVPVITADEWVDRVRADRDILSLLLVSQCAAYEYFHRLCRQWNVEYLEPLQILHLLRRHGVDTSGRAGRFLCVGLEYMHHTLENADALAAFAAHLDDDFSRFTWFCMLLFRLTLNPYYMSCCAVGMRTETFGLNSYCINRQFFHFDDNEICVDGGAWQGDTLEQFIRATGGRFRHVYSFEPVAANNHAIRKRLYALQNEYTDDFAGRISLIEKGLWSRDTVLHFNTGGVINPFDARSDVLPTAAHVVEAGMLGHIYDDAAERAASIKVPVTSIDAATGGEATFIKLEIEGSELEALNGAVETIRRNHPQMALSVYHKPEDFSTIPEFVEGLDIPYKLGFRQHYPGTPAATLLYCYLDK